MVTFLHFFTLANTENNRKVTRGPGSSTQLNSQQLSEDGMEWNLIDMLNKSLDKRLLQLAGKRSLIILSTPLYSQFHELRTTG